MLGLFFEASGVDDANVRYHDDIGRAWVAAFAQTAAGARHIGDAGCVEHGFKRGAIKDLAESHLFAVGLKEADSGKSIARIIQPQLGDVILGQPEATGRRRWEQGGEHRRGRVAVRSGVPGMGKKRLVSMGDWPCLAVMMIAVASRRC